MSDLRLYWCIGCREWFRAEAATQDDLGKVWCAGCASAVLAAHRIGRRPERVMVGVREKVRREQAE